MRKRLALGLVALWVLCAPRVVVRPPSWTHRYFPTLAISRWVIPSPVAMLEAAVCDNLRAYWKLDEAGGANNALDAHTVGPFDLTQHFSPGSNAGGVINSARTFDGSTMYFDNANAGLQNGGGDFSVQAWLWLANTTTQIGVEKGTGTFTHNEWYVAFLNGTGFSFAVFNGGTSTQTNAICGSAAPSTSTWYHFVGTFDSATQQVQCYIDASAGTALNHAHTVDQVTESFFLGRDGAGSLPWANTGRIDELAYWRKKLSGAEVTTLRNAGSGYAYPMDCGGAVTPGCKNGLLMSGVGCEDTR